MAEPTNKLVRIAENDVPLPIAGGDNKIEPSLNLLTVGFDKGNKAFAENLNYIFDNLAQWINYSQERISDLEEKHELDITALEDQIEKERVSVGEIIEITGDSTNPSVLKGYGTWESFGEGQVLVGVGEHIDDRSESKTWVDGDSEGEYQHVQTLREMARHKHSVSVSLEDNTHSHDMRGYATEGTNTGNQGGTGSYVITGEGTESDTHNHAVTVNELEEGWGDPTNNIQPSLAVYRWKRTA